MRVAATESKLVRFKLGFSAHGVYDVGRVSSDAQIRLNILDSTSMTTSFDDLMDSTTTDLKSNASSSELWLKNNQQLANDSSGAILVYVKSATSGRYELFKRLTQFTVIVKWSEMHFFFF